MPILDRSLFVLTYDLIVQIDEAGVVCGAHLPACGILGYAQANLVGMIFAVLAVIVFLCMLLSFTQQQQVRDALSESERQLRTVLSSVPDVIIVFDLTGCFRQIYTADQALLVQKPDEMIGRNLSDLVMPEEAAMGMRVIEQVIGEQRPVNTEYAMQIRDENKWFSARVVPFGSQTDPCVLWVSRDITSLMQARQKLQEDQHLLRSLLELETKAREVIAYEIHDGFVQYAIGTQMWLQSAMEQVDSLPEETAMAIRISVESTSQAIEDARSMIRDLRPVVLGEEGVVNGLRQLVDVMQKKTDIPIDFDCVLEPPDVLILLEGQVFRIVQESLNNVIRHSGATRATVRLGGNEDDLEISIVDDGCGFDPQHVAADRYGIEGIQRRASVFGGVAQVITGINAGTTVRVTLPIIKPDGRSDSAASLPPAARVRGA